MTVTTETKYRGEVPAWLNIDLLVPDSLREEVAQARERIEKALPGIATDLASASAVLSKWDDLVDRGGAGGFDLVDDVSQLVRDLTGYSELHDMVTLIEGLASSVIEGTVTDDFLAKLIDRYGRFLPTT